MFGTCLRHAEFRHPGRVACSFTARLTECSIPRRQCEERVEMFQPVPGIGRDCPATSMHENKG